MNKVTSNSTCLSVRDLKPRELISQRNVLVLKNVFYFILYSNDRYKTFEGGGVTEQWKSIRVQNELVSRKKYLIDKY